MLSISQTRKSLLLSWRRPEFRRRDFCIVSNNCWGAHIYSALGKPYLTPFVGLFFMPDCYLDLLNDFHTLVRQPLVFKQSSKYDSIGRVRSKSGHFYPIGELAPGLEVHFLHFASEAEARAKWDRRVLRIPPPTETDKCFFKLCDHDGLDSRQIARFVQCPFEHKVCFSGAAHPGCRGVVHIRECHGKNVPDGLALAQISHKYFDALDWLRGGLGRPNWASIL